MPLQKFSKENALEHGLEMLRLLLFLKDHRLLEMSSSSLSESLESLSSASSGEEKKSSEQTFLGSAQIQWHDKISLSECPNLPPDQLKNFVRSLNTGEITPVYTTKYLDLSNQIHLTDKHIKYLFGPKFKNKYLGWIDHLNLSSTNVTFKSVELLWACKRFGRRIRGLAEYYHSMPLRMLTVEIGNTPALQSWYPLPLLKNFIFFGKACGYSCTKKRYEGLKKLCVTNNEIDLLTAL